LRERERERRGEERVYNPIYPSEKNDDASWSEA